MFAALPAHLLTAAGRHAAQVLATALLVGSVAPAAAQPGLEPTQRVIPRAVLPGLGAGAARQPVDRNTAPWWSLGRVQTDVGGRCTGALIGPRTVLTAAHCLVALRSRNLVLPGSIHVLLGYHGGEWTAHGRVAAFAIGDGYRADGRGPPSADWAVLTLERPLPVPPDRVLPVLRDLPPPGTPLMLPGYQQDRPEVLLADTDCRARGVRYDVTGLPMLIHGCAGTRGTSGAPLLAQGPDGRWGVAGVASTAALSASAGTAVPAVVLPSVP